MGQGLNIIYRSSTRIPMACQCFAFCWRSLVGSLQPQPKSVSACFFPAKEKGRLSFEPTDLGSRRFRILVSFLLAALAGKSPA